MINQILNKFDFNGEEHKVKVKSYVLLVGNGSILVCTGMGVYFALCRIYSTGIYWYSHAPGPSEESKRKEILEDLL